jgi:glucosamine--fructose-6-phosphate aminotransferase (isomerizing)
MTRSFASMLALLLWVVARVGEDDELASDLPNCRIAGTSPARRPGQDGAWEGPTGAGVVVLGGGPAYGIAAEWGLKLTETSQVATAAYEPLEFRHGPISVCEPGVLVIGLVGGPGAETRSRSSPRRPGWARRRGSSRATRPRRGASAARSV